MNFDLYGFLFSLLAYFLGSVPFGLVVSSIFGTKDPRKGGSGNIGFTNVLRLSGKIFGILTLVGDLGKGWVVGKISLTFFYGNIWGLIGILAVVLGHIFPIFYKFRGGKGVATSLGGILGFHFELGIILSILWITTVGIWKYSSGGALVAYIFFPIISWLMGYKFDFLLFSILLSAIIIIKHRGNIERLLEGTENRIETS